MSISSDLIKEFVKITNDSTQPTNTESTVYGTVVESNGTKCVRLDGSDQLTPVTTTIDVSDGERVTVLIKNHTATITGNITSPAAKQVVVQNVNDKLDVAYGRIGELSADNLTISQQLNAASADIEKLEADVANIGSVTVEYLEANYTKTYDLQATYATVESLNAVNARIDNLDVGDLTADFVKTDELEAKVAALGYATVTDLTAATARIDVLETNQLTIGQLDAKYATIVNLDAAVGRIRTLESTQITTDYLSANYATISALNATELKVTNYVDSVEINGNRITAGTLTVDRLIVRGSENSIVYELNNITGALQAKSVDTLNGEIVTPRTINADKVIAGSITTTELNVDKIFGNEAVINKIIAQDAFINAISTNSIVVGASNAASSALTKANEANETADAASTTASEAKTAAQNAQTTANTASSNASTAVSTANTASTNASNALTKANTASTNASTALSTANTASTNASTALSTANTANNNASSASSKANAVNSVIAEWCWNNNTTYIDGGNIYAKSLTAEQIDVNSLFVDDIVASNTITGATLLSIDTVNTDSNYYTRITAGELYSTGAFLYGAYINGINTHYYAEATLHGGRMIFAAVDKTEALHGDYTVEIDATGMYICNGSNTIINLSQISSAIDCNLQLNGSTYANYIEANELYVCGNGHLEGKLEVEGEIVSTNSTAFRSVYGNYGAMMYFNGDNLFFMFTNSGDQYGTYNSLRPLYINTANGFVTMMHGWHSGASVSVANGKAYYVRNTSGTNVAMALMNDSNYLMLGTGVSTELHVGSGTNTGRIRLYSAGRIDIGAYGQNSNGNAVSLAGSASAPEFRPTSNGVINLGSSSYKWKYVYATNGTIQTSDRRYKSDILNLDDRYEAMAQLLVAKSFIMDMIDEKRRVGYIAQDLEEIALSVGLTMDDCSFINKDWIERKDYTGYEYSLDYTQIHTMCIASLQKQVRELQNRVAIAEAQLEHYQTQQLGS